MRPQLKLPDDFQDYAWEVESKGVFWGASVVVDGRELAVTFYDPTRLSQDVQEDVAAGCSFSVARLIVVDRVTEERMNVAVESLSAEFFE